MTKIAIGENESLNRTKRVVNKNSEVEDFYRKRGSRKESWRSVDPTEEFILRGYRWCSQAGAQTQGGTFKA